METASAHMGLVNWLGLYTLYKREVWRFMKVWNQTILAPVVTTLLFLAIFTLAMGQEHRVVDGLPFDVFICPGLIMMAVVQNAFANTSSSLMLSKIQGVIVDLLMPPFTADELTLGIIMGGVTRGVLVGIAVTSAVWAFVPIGFLHPWLAVYYIVMASMMLALIGLLTGVWANTFDQMATITNYIITPLAFLSGTFYSVKHLPEFWYAVAHLDPFFYMIDGFRYAMTGHADSSIEAGVAIMLVANVTLWLACRWIIRKGYRLKT